MTLDEPLFHSGITDQLPADHPLAYTAVWCTRCRDMVHASNNENMDHWFETNSGPYCVPCWLKAYDDGIVDDDSDQRLGLTR